MIESKMVVWSLWQHLPSALSGVHAAQKLSQVVEGMLVFYDKGLKHASGSYRDCCGTLTL